VLALAWGEIDLAVRTGAVSAPLVAIGAEPASVALASSEQDESETLAPAVAPGLVPAPVVAQVRGIDPGSPNTELAGHPEHR
jgi:HEAT repeat protein